jgi:hypothetical protein
MPNAAAKPTITDSAKIHVYASYILASSCRKGAEVGRMSPQFQKGQGLKPLIVRTDKFYAFYALPLVGNVWRPTLPHHPRHLLMRGP